MAGEAVGVDVRATHNLRYPPYPRYPPLPTLPTLAPLAPLAYRTVGM